MKWQGKEESKDYVSTGAPTPAPEVPPQPSVPETRPNIPDTPPMPIQPVTVPGKQPIPAEPPTQIPPKEV